MYTIVFFFFCFDWTVHFHFDLFFMYVYINVWIFFYISTCRYVYIFFSHSLIGFTYVFICICTDCGALNFSIHLSIFAFMSALPYLHSFPCPILYIYTNGQSTALRFATNYSLHTLNSFPHIFSLSLTIPRLVVVSTK